MANTTATAPDMARRRRGFRVHAIVFVLVMILLAGIDWLTAEPYWVHWVFLGWGAGLATHAWAVFLRKPSVPQA